MEEEGKVDGWRESVRSFHSPFLWTSHGQSVGRKRRMVGERSASGDNWSVYAGRLLEIVKVDRQEGATTPRMLCIAMDTLVNVSLGRGLRGWHRELSYSRRRFMGSGKRIVPAACAYRFAVFSIHPNRKRRDVAKAWQ